MSAEFTSDIKPDTSQYQRPKPEMEWNNKTQESYIENGFHLDRHLYTQENVFLSQVDIRKGPIERTVTKIVRLKAVDWSTEKRERKEYLYYYENWEGVNWLGIKVPPVTDHVEGLYQEALKKPEFNPNTGEPTKYVFDKERDVYYIPFTKKKVDEIIKASAHTNQESILYTVKFASADSKDGQMMSPVRGQFSHDQFTNWTFDDLYKLQTKPWKETDGNIGPVTKTLYK